MKKIGFIDYYIDEWHANEYPAMIRNSSFADRFEVALAWAEISPEGSKSLPDWCAEKGVKQAISIEQVVEECDCLLVLSPDHSGRHEDLSDLALKSGKPVYIDKPFAPTLDVAKRIIAKAEKYGAPLMSCSALRFAQPLQEALDKELKGQSKHFVMSCGGGTFPIYAIHQLEMLTMALGVGAKRIKQFVNPHSTTMSIEYGDGRAGTVTVMAGHPFQMSIRYGEHDVLVLNNLDGFFPRFIEGMLGFFDTGKSPVPAEETLAICALVEAGLKGLDRPDEWVEVPV